MTSLIPLVRPSRWPRTSRSQSVHELRDGCARGPACSGTAPARVGCRAEHRPMTMARPRRGRRARSGATPSGTCALRRCSSLRTLAAVVIRSSMIAMITIARPATKAVPTSRLCRASDDRPAQAGAVDERGDGGHRQGSHVRLVDADDDGPAGHRQLHLAQQLPLRRRRASVAASIGRSETPSRCPCAVIRISGGMAYISVHHDRSGGADAEEQRQRREVGERRHRLHGVEHRGQPVSTVLLRAIQMPIGTPISDADRHRDEGDDQQVDAVRPVAEEAEGQQADGHRARRRGRRPARRPTQPTSATTPSQPITGTGPRERRHGEQLAEECRRRRRWRR